MTRSSAMQPGARSREASSRHLPLQLAGQRTKPKPGLHPGLVAAYDPLPIDLRAGLDTYAITSIVMYLRSRTKAVSPGLLFLFFPGFRLLFRGFRFHFVGFLVLFFFFFFRLAICLSVSVYVFSLSVSFLVTFHNFQDISFFVLFSSVSRVNQHWK